MKPVFGLFYKSCLHKEKNFQVKKIPDKAERKAHTIKTTQRTPPKPVHNALENPRKPCVGL